MPRSVLDEGIADVNTTVDQIPRKIAEFIKKLV
jgi:chemotaxis response regulator CheB